MIRIDLLSKALPIFALIAVFSSSAFAQNLPPVDSASASTPADSNSLQSLHLANLGQCKPLRGEPGGCTFQTDRAVHEGGGSSTGGGHVRVCLTEHSAKKVRAVLAAHGNEPVINVDLFDGIPEQDILRVELLDLVERPELNRQFSQSFLNWHFENEDNRKGGPIHKPNESRLDFLLNSQVDMGEIFDELVLGDAVFFFEVLGSQRIEIVDEATWTRVPFVPFEQNFLPKVSATSGAGNENCVFAQAIRQEDWQSGFVHLSYDERLLDKMTKPHLAALGLHEIAYHAILDLDKNYRVHDPNRPRTSRLMTQSLLQLFARGQAFELERPSDFEGVYKLYAKLGEGPRAKQPTRHGNRRKK